MKQTASNSSHHAFGATWLAAWIGSAMTCEPPDRLGSGRLVIDTAGNVMMRYNYDLFEGIR